MERCRAAIAADQQAGMAADVAVVDVLPLGEGTDLT
jgi:hypothetical protein